MDLVSKTFLVLFDCGTALVLLDCGTLFLDNPVGIKTSLLHTTFNNDSFALSNECNIVSLSEGITSTAQPRPVTPCI